MAQYEHSKGKVDFSQAHDALAWISIILERRLHNDIASISNEAEICKVLKDGVVLCDLMNALSPGAIKKVNKPGAAFKEMENLEKFINACLHYGMDKIDLFQIPDLYDQKSVNTVINCIHALASLALKKGAEDIPYGVKIADKSTRTFTEQQITAGKAIIPLQAGVQMPSQSGMTPYGTGRQIVSNLSSPDDKSMNI